MGQLMAKLRVRKQEKLSEEEKTFDEEPLYQKACGGIFIGHVSMGHHSVRPAMWVNLKIDS